MSDCILVWKMGENIQYYPKFLESIRQKGIVKKIERNKRFQAELDNFRPLSFLHGGSKNTNDDII